MKKKYNQPQILKHDSLAEITLITNDMNMEPPCVNQGTGCTGSCNTLEQVPIGYKRSNDTCPPP